MGYKLAVAAAMSETDSLLRALFTPVNKCRISIAICHVFAIFAFKVFKKELMIQQSLSPKSLLLKYISLYFIFLLISNNALAQPTISSFSPISGPIGTTVTITGTGFNTTAANNIVFFGIVKATVTAASATSLTVTVPAGATYQPITVTVNNLTAYSSKLFLVTFTGAAPEFTSQSFEYAARIDSVDSNIETTKYAIGDVDNDDRIDVVTIDRLNNKMSVYRNTTTSGIISFAAKTDFTTGQSPRSVSVGDIDGDGKLDVVVSNFTNNTVSVFKNTSTTGNISFAAKVDFSTATQPAAISITDLDKDGKPDLVVNTINLEGYVSVLRNTSSSGTISFAPKVDLQAAGGSIEEIRTADIDGDNKPEIVLPNFGSSAITIFRNTTTVGTISFASPVNISSFTNPDNIEIGDFDADGKLDFVISHYSNTRLRVVRNASTAGNIVFQYVDSYAGGNLINGLAIVDLNGDGKLDIAANIDLQSFYLYKNISSSIAGMGFYPPVSVPALYTSHASAADFDNDGKPDLAFNTGLFRVSVWKNKTTNPYIVSFSPLTAIAGDTITIQGGNFSGATSVSIGGVAASSFTIVNSTTIRAVVGSGASGAVVVSAPYGTGMLNGFVFAGPPVISSFTPSAATTGDTVTITGQNFNGATAISFGGIAATSYSVVTPGIIRAVVGAGSSGSVNITTAYGTGTLPGFTYLPIPAISSFNPTSAPTGSTIVITGINFTGTTAVSFGNVPAASFNVVNSTTINAILANGASGNVKVTNAYGTAIRDGFIYIPPPVISSFAPVSASTGTTVTITGTNFTGTTVVTFGGRNASSFNVISPTTIKAVVNNGTSGNVAVISSAGTGTLAGFNFIPPPTINFFSPESGPVGTVVTITGSNFSNVASDNIVYFGSVKAQVISATANSLTVVVPASANYHRITVTVNNLTAFSDKPFIVTFNGGNAVFTATSFSSSVSFPAAISDPFIVNSADLDGDGKPEAILADNYGYSIAVLRNTSSGGLVTFAPKVNFATAWTPYYSTTADFNGDGKKDIAVTNGNARIISIFINTSTPGSISLAPRIDIPTETDCMGIIAEDVDADGRVDMVIWRDNSTLSILRNISANDGPVAFSKVVDVAVSYIYVESLPMRILDVDADNKPDLIFADHASGNVAVYRNTSTAETVSFAPKVEFPSPPAFITFLTLADVDADGKPDIVTNSASSSASVLRNLCTPGIISFASKMDIGTDKFAHDVNIADMNGDGKADIVVIPTTPLIAPPPPRKTVIFKNNSTPGTVSFLPGMDYIISANEVAHVVSVVDDFNGDGRLDIGSTYNNLFSVITNQVGGPVVNSFNPTAGPTGTIVTITGNGFTGTTAVSFGGVSASSFTVVSPTTITAVVAAGASGNVTVTTPAGSASLPGFTYTVVTAVNNINTNSKELAVNPNPANDIITIKHPASTKYAHLKIIDISGRTVKTIVANRNQNQTAVSVTELHTGFYQLLWSDGTRQLHKSFIVIK